MRFTKEDIEIGNRLITDFMGITITDNSTEEFKWFTGTSWSPYREDGWSCGASDRHTVERMSYDLKHFHSDWRWLMPVFEKICTLYVGKFPVVAHIGSSGIYIGINKSNAAGEEFTGQPKIVDTLNINYLEYETGVHYTLIESVWLGIVEFLKWKK